MCFYMIGDALHVKYQLAEAAIFGLHRTFIDDQERKEVAGKSQRMQPVQCPQRPIEYWNLHVSGRWSSR